MKLRDRIREVCRTRHYSPRTVSTYVHWCERFLRAVRARDGAWRRHAKLETTMTYIHVMEETGKGVMGVRSPLDPPAASTGSIHATAPSLNTLARVL